MLCSLLIVRTKCRALQGTAREHEQYKSDIHIYVYQFAIFALVFGAQYTRYVKIHFVGQN